MLLPSCLFGCIGLCLSSLEPVQGIRCLRSSFLFMVFNFFLSNKHNSRVTPVYRGLLVCFLGLRVTILLRNHWHLESCRLGTEVGLGISISPGKSLSLPLTPNLPQQAAATTIWAPPGLRKGEGDPAGYQWSTRGSVGFDGHTGVLGWQKQAWASCLALDRELH